MMVVLVLIMSCHVSEKPKIGPLILHSTSAPSAATNIQGLPNHADIVVVNLVKKSSFCLLIYPPYLYYTLCMFNKDTG